MPALTKREAVLELVSHHRISERHACTLVGPSRDTLRHEGTSSDLNVELRQEIVAVAHQRRRWVTA